VDHNRTEQHVNDYRKQVADAVFAAWSSQAVVCDHSQIIPIGSLADAALAVRDDELAEARAETERLRNALHNLNAEWTHRATNMAAASGAAPDIECARMLAGADELDRARFAISKVLNSGPALPEGRRA
jgi:hypothetical protein